MNQPDSTNAQSPIEAINSLDGSAEALEVTYQGKEWFPEDDDEWYEPDYTRGEGRAS